MGRRVYLDLSPAPDPGKLATEGVPLNSREVPRSLGGFVLGPRLGEGGMGAVYRATHPSQPGRAFALKLLHETRPAPEVLARFHREMEALARASHHPNVVRVVAGSTEGERPYFVMELVEGRSLAKLARGDGLDERKAVELVRQVADAVVHIHAHGIVHRDLKPENVVVDEGGTYAKVVDFGIARVLDATRLTQSGTSLGTVTYAAPEQLDGASHEARETSDVYALGGVLFYALTGRPPFEGATMQELLVKALVEPASTPSDVRSSVHPDLDAICLRALEKAPARRYPTAVAFRDDLDRFLRAEAVSAQGRGWRRSLGRRLRRHRLAVLAGAAVALAAVVAVVVRSLPSGSPAQERTSPPPSNSPATRGALVRTIETELAPRAGGLDRRELDRLSAAALAEPGAVNLVGELGAERLATGDALLELGSPLEPEAWKRAETLARKRLALDKNDPAAHAFAAYVALARSGAPTRPLAPGGLGPLPSADVRAHLATAASGLTGEPRARAAWLLADLLSSAGSSAAHDADAAVETARRLAPESPEGRALVRIRELPRDASGFAALLRELESAPSVAAACALSRFFALLDAPQVAEHPELALASGPALEDAVARALADDGERLQAFAPRTADAGRASDAEQSALTRASENLIEGRDTDQARATLLEALRRWPRSHHALWSSGRPEFSGLSTLVHMILGFRSTCMLHSILWDIGSKIERSASRAAPDYAVPGREGGFPADVWETSATGLAAALEFDRRLDESVRADLYLDTARHAPAGPLTDEEIALASSAAKGLRRMEELESATDLPGSERAQLAFRALLELEDFTRLGGPHSLPLRARLRLLVLPRSLGPALARLDLERVRALAAAPIAPRDEDPSEFEWNEIVLCSAALATRLPAGRTPALEDELYLLGVRWAHEVAVKTYPRHGREAERILTDRVQNLMFKSYLRPLFHEGGLTEERVRRDFEWSAEDRDRAARPYVFRPPGSR
jgi:hypothetical protein